MLSDELNHALVEFEAYLESRGHPVRTRRVYLSGVRQFARFLTPRGLTWSQVERRTIRAYLADRFEATSNDTRANYVVHLRVFFRFLVRRGVLPENPAAAVLTAKRREHLPRFLSVDDVDQLLETPVGCPRDQAILEILYSSGLKVSEVSRLNVGDLSLLSGEMLVRSRKLHQLMPISAPATMAIGAYLPGIFA